MGSRQGGVYYLRCYSSNTSRMRGKAALVSTDQEAYGTAVPYLEGVT